MPNAKVLLIDDDHELADELVSTLECEGFEVEKLASVVFTQTLEQIGADIILLDMWFDQNRSGLTLAQAIRSHPILSQKPLILISSDPELYTYAQTVRAHDFLRKPLDFEVVVERVKQLAS